MQEETTTPRNTAKRPTKKGLFQTILIILVMVFAAVQAGEILHDKTGYMSLMLDPALDGEKWDVIFAGSSHMNDAIYPMQIWKEQGIASYNNAMSAETIPVSYYTCKDVIERRHPKVLVLDVYMMYYAEKEGTLSYTHQSLDTLTWPNRLAAINDLISTRNKPEFLFPVILYHSRWKELKQSDFEATKSTANLGATVNTKVAAELADYSFTEVPEDVKLRPGDVPVEYLEKIVKLCEDTNTKLLLIALPYMTSPDVPDSTHDMSNDQAYFNWVSDFAEEHNINYINYFHLIDELGFVWSEHMKNYSHMNLWGGQIITSHIGAYLKENYGLKDHRNKKGYAVWEKRVVRYDKYTKKLLEKVKQQDSK